MIKSYRDLKVWQKAMDYVVLCYRLSNKFPKSEQYGLTAQLREAVVSIPSNIAEGHGRLTRKQYVHFLGISQGSLKESETQLILAYRLEYLEEKETEAALFVADEIGRMLGRLIHSLEQSP